jgi:O-antigen ligase
MIKLANILPESNPRLYRLRFLTTLIFLALFAFPIFPLKLSNFILILLSVATLTTYFFKPVPIWKAVLMNLVFVVPFVPYLIEFFTSGFDPVAHFEFEKKLFFFTAPFVIPIFIRVSGFKNYKLPLLIFALSVSILTIYSMIVLLNDRLLFSPSTFENGAFILRTHFENISGLHPTYYSVFALLSACFLLQFKAGEKRLFHIIRIILAILLLLAVLFLAVRIALVTGAVFLLIRIIRSRISWSKKILVAFYAIGALILLIFIIPSLHNRLNEVFSSSKEYSNQENTINQRKMILDCSLEVFSKHLLTGTGSKNFQKQLDTCYSSKGWTEGSLQDFNPHNQFLSMGVNYGLILLIIFIACLFLIFRNIYKIPEYKYFIIAILLSFLSESMLERQMGVYLFGLISLLLYNVNIISSLEKTELV